MPATFKIFGTLVLRSRHQIIAFGDLVDGEVARGMQFAAPDDPNTVGKIDAIEYVELKSIGERHTGLVMRCADPTALNAWRDRLPRLPHETTVQWA